MKILQVVSRYMRHHPVWSTFFIVFGALLFLNLSQPRPFVFYFDSGNYWGLSDNFIKQGVFFLVNFDNVLRGYLFPLIIFAVKRSASLVGISDYIGYEVIMSLVYAIFLAVGVPGLIQLLFHKKVGILQSIAFSIPVLYFWQGTLFYPLTDLLAFIFLVLGSYIILKFKKYVWSVMFSGVFWGGAALVRPVYQITLLPLLFWTIYYYHKEINYGARTILLRSIAILVGLLIVFTPQILINIAHFSTFSPFVVAQEGGTNLFTKQLGLGIVIQKYETNVGPYYPSASVLFLDRQGDSVLIKSGYKAAPYTENGSIYSEKPITLGKYLILVYKYPLDFLSIYSRHLFNGLDVVYNSLYVNDVYDSAIPMRLANYSLWFLVVIYLPILYQKLNARSMLTSRFFIPLIFASPSLVSIPTAIEVRFMLPIQLMAYALVAFWILPDFIETSSVEKKSVVLRHIFGYILFVTLCFLLSSNTYTGLQYGSYVLSRVSRALPSISEAEVLNRPGPVTIPGNEILFVDSHPLAIEKGRYYRVQFDVNALECDPSLFYIDFYGGPEYDFVGQDKYFMIKRGNHPYNAVIYAGDQTLPLQIFFRIISLSNSPLTITNLKVDLLQR